MLKLFAKSILLFATAMLLLSVINIGCSSKVLEQGQENVLEPPPQTIRTSGGSGHGLSNLG